MLKKPIFLNGKANWLSELPSTIKKFSNLIHNSIKLIPIQASEKSNQKEVYANLKDKREVGKPKFNPGQSFRTADTKKVFSKGQKVFFKINQEHKKLEGNKLEIIENFFDVSANLRIFFTDTSNIPLKNLNGEDREIYNNSFETLDFENYKPTRGETKSGRYKYINILKPNLKIIT